MTKDINKNVLTAEQSGIRHISDFVDDLTGIIQLTVGEIDLPTPENVKQAGIDAINNNLTKYTSNSGIPELRQVIADFAKQHYGIDYDYKSEVIVTVGVSEGIDLTLRTICNPGDEVIMAAPAYPAYITSTMIAGAKPVFIDTSSTSFKITPDQLEKAITPKTKAVILNYPNNPTGAVLNRDELKSLAKVIKKYDIYAITDDVYDLLVYEGNHHAPSIASVDGMKERTIVLNGLSKSHSMTGWRVGYVFAPAWLTTEMFKVHQTNVGGATSISQVASIAALTNNQNTPNEFLKIFNERRSVVMSALDKMDIPYVKPEGAFYVFADIKEFNIPSLEFTIKLLKEYKLAVVPGSAFSKLSDGYVRISYAKDVKTLEEAMNRLQSAVNDLRKNKTVQV